MQFLFDHGDAAVLRRSRLSLDETVARAFAPRTHPRAPSLEPLAERRLGVVRVTRLIPPNPRSRGRII